MAEPHNADCCSGILVHNTHVRGMSLGPLALKVVRPPPGLVVYQRRTDTPLTYDQIDCVDNIGDCGREQLRVVKYIGNENDVIDQSVSIHGYSVDLGQLFNP